MVKPHPYAAFMFLFTKDFLISEGFERARTVEAPLPMHWLTPGASFGIVGWLLASVGLRIYMHFFDNYSATYACLGAVIILLTWFYLTGLMLLIGAEINSEIEARLR
jgi:YihY family inner membrane protein